MFDIWTGNKTKILANSKFFCSASKRNQDTLPLHITQDKTNSQIKWHPPPYKLSQKLHKVSANI